MASKKEEKNKKRKEEEEEVRKKFFTGVTFTFDIFLCLTVHVLYGRAWPLIYFVKLE